VFSRPDHRLDVHATQHLRLLQVSHGRRGAGCGFTLVELLVVLSLIAIASGIVALALRDPSASRLDRESVRLSALLEAGRAESRSSGVSVSFEFIAGGAGGFRFVGTPAALALPGHWLDADMRGEIVGARALALGPEPILPPTRLRLVLGERQLLLASDGLSPFGVANAASP
jgi:general secretion pathway protein H